MNKVLHSIYDKIDYDHKAHRSSFNQKPYFRMIFLILSALNRGVFSNERNQAKAGRSRSGFLNKVFHAVADLFHMLNPCSFPGFAFSWLDLVSHQDFMPNLLKRNDSQSNEWFKLHVLMTDLFSFLKANLSAEGKQPQALSLFYEKTLCLCVRLLNDYPSFLCEYHFNFVNKLPEHCI